MIVPGKVMYIEGNGNTYVEQIDTGGGCSLTGGNGPSYDTATRLEGYGSPLPVVQAPVGADKVLWLRASGDHYLIVKKLSFDAANQAVNGVVVFPIAHHVRFEEVEAKNTVGGFETFYLTGASNIELIDTFLHDAGTHALTLDASITNFLCQRCHLFNAAGKGLNINSNGTKANLTFQETEVRNTTTDIGVDIGASTGTLLQNLLVRSNGSHGVKIRSGATGTRVYNNTIYGNTGVGLQCDSGATSTELRNNIIYGNTGGNLQNNCGATVSANLQTDPLFVAPPTDLHLADGSPAIDAGENIPSILTDYAGQPRQQGAQDIGAYERTQIPTSSPDVTVRQLDLKQAGWYF
jgi:Right handed beta helix region